MDDIFFAPPSEYISWMKKVRPLSSEEEELFMSLVKRGDKDAIDELFSLAVSKRLILDPSFIPYKLMSSERHKLVMHEYLRNTARYYSPPRIIDDVIRRLCDTLKTCQDKQIIELEITLAIEDIHAIVYKSLKEFPPDLDAPKIVMRFPC